MNFRTTSNILLICFAIARSASGQGFINMNFEQASVSPTLVNTYGSLYADPALVFPGWSVGSGSGNYTLYNNLTLGSVAQVLVGPNHPNAIGYTPLQGSYSALLQFGPHATLGTPALFQTGLVPSDARSITFLVSATQNDARVTLGGVDIPLVSVGGGRLAGDIRAFAGQQAELMFSTKSYEGNWLYFDDVMFSATAVPEPSVCSLAVLGLVATLLVRKRSKKVA